MILKRSSVILFLIFLTLGLNRGTGIIYTVIFVIFGLTLSNIISQKKIGFSKLTFLDFIPFLFLFVWIYGIIVGLVYSNNLNYIIANNGGMMLYLSYYVFLHFRLDKERLYKLVMLCAVCVGAISIILVILYTYFGYYNEGILKIILGEFTSGASTGQNRVFFTGQIILFIPLAVYLGRNVMSSRQYTKSFKTKRTWSQMSKDFFGLLLVCVVVFIPASKGFLLGFIFLFLCIPLSIFSNSLKKGQVNVKIITYVLLVAISSIALLSLSYSNMLLAIFDQQDNANVFRYEQLLYIWNDLKMWGNGSGAVISGYFRSEEKPYGFELSYIALAHKIGIVSLLVFIMYIITISKACIQLLYNRNSKYAMASLGAMGFLLPAIGNPYLFAPQCVVLHCIAIYFLKTRTDE